LLLLFALVGVLIWLGGPADSLGAQAPLVLIEGEADPVEYARAYEPRDFSFPADHGPHFDFQTEWWYFTGNLENDDGDHFGYQLTFFRRGLSPEAPDRASAFATSQVYFAHLAITDVPGGAHHEAERFSRGAAGLAGANSTPFQVWLEDWRLESLNEQGSLLRLIATDEDFGLDLILNSHKPIVLHGFDGLSPKSADPGNASYYLSYTRLETYGNLSIRDDEINVRGESWFDHEWSTSALGAEALGWDWFGLQLSDGRDLMLAVIRNADGTIDPVSGGTIVEADGNFRALGLGEFELRVLDRWTSPESGADYPASWQISIPSADLDLIIDPWLEDQEMNTSFIYWEGAVRITGLSNGQEIVGHGYAELTGYVQSLQGVF
jgi:predicted secreted hydrolase